MFAIAPLCFLSVVVESPAAATCSNRRQADLNHKNLWGVSLLQRKSTPLRRRGACSIEGADCRSTRCCIDADLTCYEKNKSWAACKNSCDPSGDDDAASNHTRWSCIKLIGDTTTIVEERAHATEANSSVIAGSTMRMHATGDSTQVIRGLLWWLVTALEANSSVTTGNATRRMYATGGPTQVVRGLLWWLLVGCILGCFIVGFAWVARFEVSQEDADCDTANAVYERDLRESLWIEGTSNRGQIDNWYRMVSLNASCHQILSDYYFKVNATLNMAQVIFAAIAGSSGFASIGQGKITISLGITAGFFSMSSAVLTAIRKEMNYDQKVERHTQAGKTFVILAMKHEELRLRCIPYIHEEVEPKAGADNIDAEWKAWYDRLKEAIQESPFIDSTTWENMKASQRKAMPPLAQLPIALPDVSS